jgi:hypothetical protein
MFIQEGPGQGPPPGPPEVQQYKINPIKEKEQPAIPQQPPTQPPQAPY